MKFAELAKYLDRLEKTSSRIEITRILARLFGEACPDEIDKIVYLSLGALAPSFKGVILNIAEKIMIRVLSRAFDQDVDKVKLIYKRAGDLGNIAQELSKTQKLKNSKTPSVIDVYEKLLEIARNSGDGSQERKIGLLAKLLQSLDPLSARFAARIPVGRLRLGFSDKTVLDALSWMETGGKSAKADL